VSSYLIAIYAGNSLPVIGIGLLSAAATTASAHIVFSAVIAILCAAAFVIGAKYSRPSQ
jgi:hypothetical protein